MKKKNKGFTLVELIVVLVILAILAAILVPALLGYIDKAREKQITTNAEAAYVAAQALATEAYGKKVGVTTTSSTETFTQSLVDQYVIGTSSTKYNKIINLTDIQATIQDITVTYKNANASSKKYDHDAYIIDTFSYKEGDKVAFWTRSPGISLTVTKDGKTETEVSTAGGWVVGDNVVVSSTP